MNADTVLIKKGEEFYYSQYCAFGPKHQRQDTWFIARDHDEYESQCYLSPEFGSEEEAKEALACGHWPEWFTEWESYYVLKDSKALFGYDSGKANYLAANDYTIGDFLVQYTKCVYTYEKNTLAEQFLSQFNLTLREVLDALP